MLRAQDYGDAWPPKNSVWPDWSSPDGSGFVSTVLGHCWPTHPTPGQDFIAIKSADKEVSP
ncbi:hypothetical protein HPP92_010976 [Vanilla planifolia]|uniref:Uncharacterized protein n=1 Tax=Vanilla planifolia TaxID=51239 RepID=A0A835R1P1_VANPL|nr:hypothetical protein HPP92_011337 [Vanilla planifolia]KAG0482892.1 hypothetical protein HPP92_010976 [Vanilla planifolia]